MCESVTRDYLTFDKVTKAFGPVPVVSESTLSIARNSLVVFLGPSGCGKTTLMRMAGGLDTPTSGTIGLDGEAVAGPDRRRGMVFQSYSSFPWLTVEGNIAFGMRYRNDLNAAQRTERVSHYLKLIGLEDFAKSFPNRISGACASALPLRAVSLPVQMYSSWMNPLAHSMH